MSEDPFKEMTRKYDAAVVTKGGRSIFDIAKPRHISGPAYPSARPHALGIPKRDGYIPLAMRKPKKAEPPRAETRIPFDKPGRIVAGLTGKLGGYVSDLDESEVR